MFPGLICMFSISLCVVMELRMNIAVCERPVLGSGLVKALNRGMSPRFVSAVSDRVVFASCRSSTSHRGARAVRHFLTRASLA